MLRTVLKTAAVVMLAASFNAGAAPTPESTVTAGAPSLQTNWWPPYPYCPPFMPRQFCPKA